MIHAISISRQWSIHNLYGYALDHLKRQFLEGKIHPAVVLGVAREYGIPNLIEPAVKALAKTEVHFSSWSTDPNVLRHITVKEIGDIGRMKEKLLLARFALCAVPRVTHDANCPGKTRLLCSASWSEFWMSTVVPKLCNLDGEIDSLLWWIRTDCVAKARVAGMTSKCMEWMVNDVIGSAGWRAETKIPQGAVDALMVSARDMLEPGLDDAPMS